MAIAHRVAIPLLVAILLGLGMRFIAHLAGMDWVIDNSLSRPLILFVNIAAIWVISLGVASAWSSRSPSAAAAAGVLLAWIALALYYGSLLPSTLHERLWFGVGIVGVALFAALVAQLPVRSQLLAISAPLLIEPFALTLLMFFRAPVDWTDSIPWLIEFACGLALIGIWLRLPAWSDRSRAASSRAAQESGRG